MCISFSVNYIAFISKFLLHWSFSSLICKNCKNLPWATNTEQLHFLSFSLETMRLITLCWLEVHGYKLQGSPLHFECPSPFSHQSKSSQWRQRQTESCLSRIPVPAPAVPGTQMGAKQVDAEPKGDEGRRMKEGSRVVLYQTPGAHTQAWLSQEAG